MSEHKFSYKWNLSDISPAGKDAPTVFGTFICGGGATMGYKLAGFRHLGGVEIDPRVAAVYAENHHPQMLYVEDLREFNKRDDLPPELYDLDVLDGSPPCSTFSMAGKREEGWGKKKRFREGQSLQTLDDLVFVYCETINKLRPKIALLENVAGLVNGNARSYCKKIIQLLNGYGYECQIFLLNAAKMGVPQTRQRTFFICRRKDLDLPALKINVDEPPIVLGEVIDWTNTKRRMNDGDYAIWQRRKPADCSFRDTLHRESGTDKRFGVKYLHKDRVCNTICASDWCYLYDYPRKLTPSEKLLIFSFPQDYKASESQIDFICGMSVAPVQMAHIASAIREQMLKK